MEGNPEQVQFQGAALASFLELWCKKITPGKSTTLLEKPGRQRLLVVCSVQNKYSFVAYICRDIRHRTLMDIHLSEDDIIKWYSVTDNDYRMALLKAGLLKD